MNSESHSPANLRRTWLQFVFCIVITVTIALRYSAWIPREQPYDDLVFGLLALLDGSKVYDYVLVGYMVGIFCVLAAVVSWTQRMLEVRWKGQNADIGLLLTLIPAGMWIATLLGSSNFRIELLQSTIDATLYTAVALALLIFGAAKAKVKEGSLPDRIKAGLFAWMLGGFSVMAVVCFWSRFANAYIDTDILLAWMLAGGFTACLAVVFALMKSESVEACDSAVNRIIFRSQLLLPLLLAVLLPNIMVQNNEVQPRDQPAILLKIVVCALVAAGVVNVYRKGRKNTGFAGCWKSWVSPVAILCIVVLLSERRDEFPALTMDDFHLGEHLLPWQQWRDFGKLPFVDFMPVHPLMDLGTSFFNDVFYDGTLAHFRDSQALLYAGAAAATFWAISKYSTPCFALLLCCACDIWNRLLFIVPLLLLLAHPSWLQRRMAWIISWIVLCPLYVFYNPSSGVAIVLATTPIAAWQTFHLIREDKRIWKIAGVALVLLVVCWFATPLGAVMRGFVGFMRENGQSVVPAHGISWSSTPTPYFKGIFSSPILWELVRFSWIWVALWAGWTFFKERSAPNNPDSISRRALAGMITLFLVAMMSWSLNRVDPANFSRTGEVSYLATLYLLPLILIARRRTQNWKALLGIFVVSLYAQAADGFPNSGSTAHTSFTAETILAKAQRVVNVPPTHQNIRDTIFGRLYPNLGAIYIEGNKAGITALTQELRFLKNHLRQNETFADLSYRQALYFYFGMPVPTSYGALWLTANTALQQQTLEEFKTNPPPVVLVAPKAIVYLEAPSLRTYRVYRHLVSQYSPVKVGETLFLVKPDRVAESERVSPTQELDLLVEGFEVPPTSAPSHWGRSWDRLEKLFTPHRPVSFQENGPELTADFSTQEVEGKRGEFLRYQAQSNVQKRVKYTLSWESERGSFQTQWNGGPGVHLVPLGAHPGWLLSSRIRQIKLSAADEQGTAVPVHVSAAQLYSLNAP